MSAMDSDDLKAVSVTDAVHSKLEVPISRSGGPLLTAEHLSRQTSDGSPRGSSPRFVGASSVATSSAGWSVPDHVVIIIDFDDTIFPTTAFRNRVWFRTWMSAKGTEPEIAEEDKAWLLEFDLAAATMLRECMDIASVTCVTLAARPWVTRCLETFLPACHAAFQDHKVEVYYAREEKNVRRQAKGRTESNEEDMANNEGVYVRQKMKAMEKVCKKAYGTGSWKNVLSIGDGPAERCALQDIGFSHSNPVSKKSGQQKFFRIKTLKMLEEPTCEQLTTELKLLTSWIYPIVQADHDIDVELDAGEDGLQAVRTLMGELVTDCCAIEHLEPTEPARSPGSKKSSSSTGSKGCALQ